MNILRLLPLLAATTLPLSFTFAAEKFNYHIAARIQVGRPGG